MKTKHVFYGLISLHVIFHDNRTIRTVILNIKILQVKFWERKRAKETRREYRHTEESAVFQ